MPRDDRGHATALEDRDGGGEVTGLLAEIRLMVGSLRESATAPRRPRVPWEACHPVPIAPGGILLSAGAGTADLPDSLGPKDPWWWDLRSLAAWGFTAGTVTAFLNDKNGAELAVWNTPGEFTWSSQKMLAPRDRIIFVAASITGTVSLTGQAIEVASPWLPEYLM